MIAIVDCPEARWLPSRHRFALARLIALIALRREKRPVPLNQRLVVPIDRDQSSLENYAISFWLMTTLTSYLLVLFRPALWILTPFLAAVLIQIPFYFSGLLVAPVLRAITGKLSEKNHRLNTISLFATFALVSAWFAWTLTWARFVAYFFFAVLAANALAFVVMLALRGVVRRIESQYGGTPFAP